MILRKFINNLKYSKKNLEIVAPYIIPLKLKYFVQEKKKTIER